jgi:hypothetical protein
MFLPKVIGAGVLLIHTFPLNDEKVVWCTVNAIQIFGPIFYAETVGSDRYVRLILKEFFAQRKRNDHACDLSMIQQLQTIFSQLWKRCLVTE